MVLWSVPTQAQTHSTGGDPPTIAVKRFHAGLVLERSGKLGEACTLYGQAVQMTPDWPLARYELAQCLRLTGDLTGMAATHIQSALVEERQPLVVEAARISEDAGLQDAAQRHYDRGRVIAPNDARALLGRIRTVTAKDARAGYTMLQVYARRSPAAEAVWRHLASVAEARNDLDEAESAWRQVLQNSGNTRSAAAALGAFAQRVGRQNALETAVRAFRDAR